MDLLKFLTSLPNGDQVNIIQAASENEGTLKERLQKGIEEIIPAHELEDNDEDGKYFGAPPSVLERLTA
jgi:hypothetical protein